jgi:serine/threonine-protein kinase
MTPLATTINLPERFQAERFIANGGMGSVWEAHDRVLRRSVAIKLLAPHLAADEVAVARFNREARAGAGLGSHPNVVTIFDVGSHEGTPYLVMELLRGGTVADVARAGAPVARERALRWISAAAAGLDHAHAQGVVHRDVKPANLLLDDADDVVIADFGLARIAFESTVTSTGTILGTASYLSPEQIRGEPATALSDVYALAVVAFELLTGSKPFEAEHFAAQANMHLEREPPRASQIETSLPAAVDGVLTRGLAKDPGARWATATELADALTRAALEPGESAIAATTTPTAVTEQLKATPGPATAPGSPRPPRPGGPAPLPPRGRAPGRLALAALLAMLVAVIAGIALAGGDDGGRRDGPASSTGGRSRPATTTSGSAQNRPAAAPAQGASPGGDLQARQLEGFRLMNAGRYDEAIPVLRAVVASYPAGTEARCARPQTPDCLTFAYALFNLGRSLRLSGDAAGAVPVLERRLAIDNQREVVQRELDAARAALGGSVSPGPGRKAKGKGKPKDR